MVATAWNVLPAEMKYSVVQLLTAKDTTSFAKASREAYALSVPTMFEVCDLPLRFQPQSLYFLSGHHTEIIRRVTLIRRECCPSSLSLCSQAPCRSCRRPTQCQDPVHPCTQRALDSLCPGRRADPTHLRLFETNHHPVLRRIARSEDAVDRQRREGRDKSTVSEPRSKRKNAR